MSDEFPYGFVWDKGEGRPVFNECAFLRERLRIAHEALDFIVADGTITPSGCPEPWHSTLIEWSQAAAHGREAARAGVSLPGASNPDSDPGVRVAETNT